MLKPTVRCLGNKGDSAADLTINRKTIKTPVAPAVRDRPGRYSKCRQYQYSVKPAGRPAVNNTVV